MFRATDSVAETVTVAATVAATVAVTVAESVAVAETVAADPPITLLATTLMARRWVAKGGPEDRG